MVDWLIKVGLIVPRSYDVLDFVKNASLPRKRLPTVSVEILLESFSTCFWGKNFFFKKEREKKNKNLIFFLVVKGTLSLETSNVSLETKQKILITNFFWVWCVWGDDNKNEINSI